MKPEGFADVHQHVLWGLDDGPKTASDMAALLQQDAEQGIGLVFATSHAYPKMRPFDLALYEERLHEANAYCKKQGLPLHIVSGCEIHYCSTVPDHLAAGRLPTLGQSRSALIEFDLDASLDYIGEAADALYRAGHTPVLAHVERYRCFARSPEHALSMREEYGLIYQMNCETVLQPRGFFEQRFVKRMLERRAIDVLATDAHDIARRPVRMREAHQKIAKEQGADYADLLTGYGWRFIGAEGTDKA